LRDAFSSSDILVVCFLELKLGWKFFIKGHCFQNGAVQAWRKQGLQARLGKDPGSVWVRKLLVLCTFS
jgi:hypothetical protein